MVLKFSSLSVLAQQLTSERKRQGLSREQAAAVCNVSPSFIRDAESAPARCSMGLLLQYMTGLGLSVAVEGWSYPPEAQAASRLAGDSGHEESPS